MLAFRVILGLILVILSAYTAKVLSTDGFTLFQVFFGDMAKLQWAGQFNLDFLFMLVLSAGWVAWRNRFSPKGLGLAVLAFFLGSAFLGVYLLVLSFQPGATGRSILIGTDRE
jgi:hypothetical protein